ncbi:MAG: hypothetical protein ICV77_15570 [Cyanobacteria bacterium Co-bin8]|nr:hypothetical protein [Cyanobacteria bacterium Co-bin8]
MTKPDPDPSQTLERLQLLLYLVPVFGFFPALWSLYLKQGSRQEKAISRLVVTLAVGWLLTFGILSAGGQLAPSLSLRLLVSSTLVTTGYFTTNLWLMIRLLRGKPVKLPGISQLSNRLP